MLNVSLRSSASTRAFVLFACLVGFVSQCWAAISADEPPGASDTTLLRPGDFVWVPQLSPAGPMLIFISLPEQRAYIYRNGIRIGISTVSTGKEGHRTPTGVFTILQKHREHYSNLYDNAPMPFMQRLTWGGVALHAGTLPGYPASHGCVRLPHDFSEKLFDTTRPGTTVVITDVPAAAPSFVAPEVLVSLAPTTVPPLSNPDVQDAEFVWSQKIATEGPVSVILSTRDHYVVVLRNGVEIGHAPVTLNADTPSGTRAYMVLEGSSDVPSILVPGRPALRWFSVASPAQPSNEGGPRAFVAASGLRISPQFAQLVYDLLTPGATLVVTDERIRPDARVQSTILQADTPLNAPERVP